MSDALKIIGCIHLPPLPGSPGYQFDPRAILAWALKETETYLACGLSDLIVENTADIPYLKGQVYPETVVNRGTGRTDAGGRRNHARDVSQAV